MNCSPRDSYVCCRDSLSVSAGGYWTPLTFLSLFCGVQDHRCGEETDENRLRGGTPCSIIGILSPCGFLHLIDPQERAAGYFCLGSTGEHVKVVPTSVF